MKTTNFHWHRVLAVGGAVAALTVAALTVAALTVAALTVAALTVAGASFAAAPSVDTPSAAVRFDDLNLSTTTGVNALYRRISAAARAVCPDVHSRDLNVVAAGERCQANAVAEAVSRLNNPALALVHAARVSHG